MYRNRRAFSFAWTHGSFRDVMLDHNLASLGDSYVNFIFSLASSSRKGEPVGVKVKGSELAEALRRAGLRGCMPSRMSKHELADAAEALVVYGWLSGCVDLQESVIALLKGRESVDGLSRLLVAIKERITFL